MIARRPTDCASRNLRIWACVLSFGLLSQPVALFAQGISQQRGVLRSQLSSFSSRNAQGQGGASGLPGDTREHGLVFGMTISKGAYDAVIKPGDYVLGPGDVFSVLVDTGEGLILEEVPIGAQGGLVIPFVGIVQVAGMRLGDAQVKIDSAISGRFRHLDMEINLFRLRSFPINVVGEVKRPGAYRVNGVEQASELILRAGGVLASNGQSSLRNIRILKASSNGRLVSDPSRRVDLVLWGLTGDAYYNPYLVDGDQIHVPVKGDSITVAGGVHRPGSYEYAEGDQITDLIDLGRGLIGSSETATAELLRLESSRSVRQPIDLSGVYNGNPSADLALQPGDKLFVTGERPRLTLQGEVRFPGAYPIEEGLRLKTLIERAGGFTSLASVSQAVLIRRVEYGTRAGQDAKLARLLGLPRNQLSDGDLAYIAMNTQQAPGRLPVDFVALFENGDESHNVELKGDDLIHVPRLRPTVLVNGAVVAPAAIPYDPAYDVDAYIRDAGGFTSAARRGDVYVIQGSTGHSLRASKVNDVSPGDAIFVPSKTQGQGWRTFREALVVASQVASLALVIDAIYRR